MALQFKFVELSIVTDETLEECVNEWVGKGEWVLEGIRFVLADHSKRPAMAFVSFTRDVPSEVADKEAPRRPPPLLKAVPAPAAGDPHVIVAADDDEVD